MGIKVEVLGVMPFDIDWHKETYDCHECGKCPFCDDSSGFYWCVWLKRRVGVGKPSDCRVIKVEVEEKK